MPHATPVVQDLDKSKAIARAIQKRFDELNSPIKLNHAYEALAIAHRHPNWATMKAAIGAPVLSSAIRDEGAFILGQRVVRHDDESGPEDIELPHEDSLKHIHCFATSAETRREVLKELGDNAISQGSSAIFIEPVSDEASKSLLLNRIMDLAAFRGRRRDFFVLDLSDPNSRVGNSCDILEEEQSPEACANLLLSEYTSPGYGDWFDAHRFICECARRVLEKGFKLDIEGICTELRKIEVEGIPSAWLDELGNNYAERTRHLAHYLAISVEVFAKRHRKFFDRTSPWPGFMSILSRPQVLVIFVPAEPKQMEDALSKIAMNALRKAMTAPRKSGVPAMILVNDSGILEQHNDLADLAAAARVCLVLADQCPTLPYQFGDDATEIRSRRLESQSGSCHQLINGAEEVSLWPGLRSSHLKPSKTGKLVRRGGILEQVP